MSGLSTHKLLVGNDYTVDHSRKGMFVITVTHIDKDWVTGKIISGNTDTLLDYNVQGVGEETTMRRSLCTFFPYGWE